MAHRQRAFRLCSYMSILALLVISAQIPVRQTDLINQEDLEVLSAEVAAYRKSARVLQEFTDGEGTRDGNPEEDSGGLNTSGIGELV